MRSLVLAIALWFTPALALQHGSDTPLRLNLTPAEFKEMASDAMPLPVESVRSWDIKPGRIRFEVVLDTSKVPGAPDRTLTISFETEVASGVQAVKWCLKYTASEAVKLIKECAKTPAKGDEPIRTRFHRK
jgi:hypothetical protein